MSEIWKNRKADDVETHMETSPAGMNRRNKDSYIKWWNKSFSNSVPDQDREQAKGEWNKDFIWNSYHTIWLQVWWKFLFAY